MSLVNCHEMGMLISVMRALKHMEAHALRRQCPFGRSSAAAAGSAIGVATMKRTYEP
jgi:DNA invertase Pin-like site-specific DNA recombinase